MKISNGVKILLGLSASMMLLSTGCASTAVVANTESSYIAPLTSSASIATPSQGEPTIMPPATSVPEAVSASGDTPAVAPWDNLSQAVMADFTPAQLYAEYKADPKAADARYYGQVFIFRNVVIDEMAMLYKGMASPSDAWVINAMVYFKTENKSRIMNLKVGDIVEITGTIVGPMQNYVLVDHCSFKLIDDTNGITRPNWVDIPG